MSYSRILSDTDKDPIFWEFCEASCKKREKTKSATLFWSWGIRRLALHYINNYWRGEFIFWYYTEPPLLGGLWCSFPKTNVNNYCSLQKVKWKSVGRAFNKTVQVTSQHVTLLPKAKKMQMNRLMKKGKLKLILSAEHVCWILW